MMIRGFMFDFSGTLLRVESCRAGLRATLAAGGYRRP